MTAQLEDRRTEPNSGLEKAIIYFTESLDETDALPAPARRTDRQQPDNCRWRQLQYARLPDYVAQHWCKQSRHETSLILVIVRRGIITRAPERLAGSLLAGSEQPQRSTTIRLSP